MLFELKNETNNEILDIMSPHARGSGGVDKQTKHQPREMFDNNTNIDGENTSIRKRNNKRNEKEDIYAEKKDDGNNNKKDK